MGVQLLIHAESLSLLVKGAPGNYGHCEVASWPTKDAAEMFWISGKDMTRICKTRPVAKHPCQSLTIASSFLPLCVCPAFVCIETEYTSGAIYGNQHWIANDIVTARSIVVKIGWSQ